MRKILVIFSLFILSGCNEDSFYEKLDKESAKFIGKKYSADPLGEGKGYDKDPIIRDDEFDCVTYVETSIAYARGGDVIKNKIKISYIDGIPDYLHRKHFWEFDQDKSGTIIDQTKSVGAGVEQISGTINKERWFSKKNPPVKSLFKPVKMEITYIPSKHIPEIDFSLMPDISIIGIIGYNEAINEKIGSDIFVYHVGFVLKTADGKIIVRHASERFGVVVEQSWNDFISGQMNLKNRIGIKLWRIKAS